MTKFNTILFPTDLSNESDEGLRYALGLACAYNAKLILLYCRKPGYIAEWATSSGAERRFEQLLFTHMDADELKLLNWEASVAQGDDIGQAIADQARDRNVDLIVMRSRRRPHAAALLGSTAETVCKSAPCPVFVTHPTEREWVGYSTPDVDLRRVLIAYDKSRDADLALNFGISFAEQYQAEIHVLHVMSNEGSLATELASSEARRQDSIDITARRLRESIPREAYLWCNVVTAVRSGAVWREIIEYATQYEIDLICLGASSAGFSLERMFGSTADRVMRNAPCPVFVARRQTGASNRVKAAHALVS